MLSKENFVTMSSEQPPQPARPRKHWWLLAIPYLWCIAAIPMVNRIDYVFGNIPFLLVWMIAGVVISSVCVSAVYLIDRSRGDLERI